MNLSKTEKEALNAQSLEAFGNKRQWEKLLTKGELVVEKATTANGNAISVKRQHYLTLEIIKERMTKILADNAAALEAAKVAAEAQKAIDAAKTVVADEKTTT